MSQVGVKVVIKMLTERWVQWSETSLMLRTERHNQAAPTQYDSGTCPGRLSQTEFPSQCAAQ